MTDTYTAPTNGHEIRSTSNGGLRINKPGMGYASGHEPQTLVAGRVESLREYFRDERDRELGVWRWGNESGKQYLVRKLGYGDKFRVVREEHYEQLDWAPEQYNSIAHSGNDMVKAIQAYREAHPEKKPWLDANPGEVWVVDFEAGVTEAVVVPPSGWVKGLAVVAARRIWPENKES